MRTNRFKTLQSIPLFSELDACMIDKAFKEGGLEERSLRPGEALDQEDMQHKLLCITSGAVDIEHLHASGELYVVEHFEKGECIGANAMFLKGVESMPMQIESTQSTTLLSIDQESLFKLLTEDRQFLERFLALVSRRSLTLAKKVSVLSSQSLREKIIDYVKVLHNDQSQNPIILPVSKTKLARMFSVARTSLSRRLKALEEEQLIIVRGKTITLLEAFFRQ